MTEDVTVEDGASPEGKSASQAAPSTAPPIHKPSPEEAQADSPLLTLIDRESASGAEAREAPAISAKPLAEEPLELHDTDRILYEPADSSRRDTDIVIDDDVIIGSAMIRQSDGLTIRIPGTLASHDAVRSASVAIWRAMTKLYGTEPNAKQ